MVVCSSKLEISIGFGAYNNEGMKLGISPMYSATMGLKTGCHGYFVLIDICRTYIK